MRERFDMIGKRSVFGLAVVAAVATVFTACDGTSDTACTEIGCGDGLYVVVQALSVTLDPTYEDFQPNGPDCPPICWQARAEVDLTSG